VNVVERIDSAAGRSPAAPEPLERSGRDQRPSDQARPASSEESVNRTMPARRPPPTEQVGRPPAQEQEAAEEEGVGADHPLEVLLGESESILIEGNATFTIAMSRTTMN